MLRTLFKNTRFKQRKDHKDLSTVKTQKTPVKAIRIEDVIGRRRNY